MAKKRRIVSRRKKFKEKPKKEKGFNKKTILIAFAVVFILMFLFSLINQYSGKVVVTNLKLKEGEKDYINFDIKHTFSGEKECFADIKIYQNSKVVCSEIKSLGMLEPNNVVSKSLFMPFPEGETDFNVEISCR